MLITFSGLDGAGKTTLIAGLEAALKSRGHRVTVLTMYDDIAFYSYIRRIRDGLKAYRGSPRTGVRPAPVPRKNEREQLPGDPLTDVSDKSGSVEKLFYRIVRSGFFRRPVLFCDLVSLLVRRLLEEGWRRNILITDRYIYDSLADVADLRGRRWLYIRLFLLLVPIPDAPVFIDAPVEKAFERKQEFPIGYMEWRRRTYQKIFGWVWRPVVLANEDLGTSMKALETVVLERLAGQ